MPTFLTISMSEYRLTILFIITQTFKTKSQIKKPNDAPKADQVLKDNKMSVRKSEVSSQIY